jgi:acetyl esterase/lipase
VRRRAREWEIDPHRIGVLGFSAGGHLASLLSTQPSLHLAPDDDLAGHVSARPDLVVLVYPLVSFVDGYPAWGSRWENGRRSAGGRICCSRGSRSNGPPAVTTRLEPQPSL